MYFSFDFAEWAETLYIPGDITRTNTNTDF